MDRQIEYPLVRKPFYNYRAHNEEAKMHNGWYCNRSIDFDHIDHSASRYPGCDVLNKIGIIDDMNNMGMTLFSNKELLEAFPTNIENINNPDIEHYSKFQNMQEQFRTKGPIINSECIGLKFMNNIGVDTLYNFRSSYRKTYLNGIADYVIMAWAIHGHIIIDPTIVLNCIVTNITKTIDEYKIRGIFSGSSERQNIDVECDTDDHFCWGIFIEKIKSKLSPTAMQTLTPIYDLINAMTKKGHPIIAGSIATQLIGSMKHDFELITYMCAMTGIILNKNDPLWNNVKDLIIMLPTLIPLMKEYCNGLSQIINRWLNEDFTHCTFSVENCASAHSKVYGDIVFMVSGNWTNTEDEFLDMNCYGFVHWTNKYTNEKYVGVSGITECDIIPLNNGYTTSCIISPCWSFSKYLYINDDEKIVPDYSSTNCPSYVGQSF